MGGTNFLKVSKSYIQAIAVVVILAELPEGIYVKSKDLSEAMQVSHAYLLKIGKELRNAGIIESSASRNGGYCLKKPIEDILFLDLFEVFEGAGSFSSEAIDSVLHTLFKSDDLLKRAGDKGIQIAEEAEGTYKAVLAKHSIAEIVPRDDHGDYLMINWPEYLATHKDHPGDGIF